MRWTSVVAIYALFWSLCFFLVLPFRPQDKRAEDRVVPGQFPGAPVRFSFPRACLWTTIVSGSIFFLFYLNYVFGWVPASAFNFVPAGVITDH